LIDILLDSGAWSAYTQNLTIDLDEYMQFIYDHKPLLTSYINLDVIDKGEASYQNWVTMRAEGLDPMPVWHVYTDERYLKRYMKKSEYVGIGDVAKMPTDQRTRTFDRLWPELEKSGVKFHGLGVTAPKLIAQYPWHSVDSTSWVKYGRYGIIIVPQKNRYDINPLSIFITQRTPHRKKLRGRHITELRPIERDRMIKYIESRGFKLGKSELKPVPEDYKLKEGEQWAGREDCNNGALWGGSYNICGSSEVKRMVEVTIEKGVSTCHIERDALNLAYYLEVNKNLGKKVYLAGNFPAMKNPEIEHTFKQTCLRILGEYNRLISFHFEPDIQTVLNIKRKELGNEAQT
jgi:hypothetical protein